MNRRRRPVDCCWNPRCQDWLPKFGPGGSSQVWLRMPLAPICPSCRLAGQWGAALVFAIAVVIEVLRRWL
jgi:hypothetical protein